MKPYGEEFYRELHDLTALSARRIASLLLPMLPPVRSAVDVGCGLGTWLAALRELGVEEIQGVEGSWVNPAKLRIPAERLLTHDLTTRLTLERRFDLAISLEVAEHLPEASAETFVAGLCELADFVLFSAAIPHQGGVSHQNEQWPDYWARKFEKGGYGCFDVIRPRIWNDDEIATWYKQNTLLFVKSGREGELKPSRETPRWPLPLVHPQELEYKMALQSSPGDALRLLTAAVRRALRRRLGRERG